LSRTESLARIVNPLSTRAVASHRVSLSAAFFRVWRLTRHIMLFDYQSSASLASCSRALTPYVFNPINHFRLASFHEPHSLRCGIKHLSHNAGAVFAFLSLQSWNRTNYLHFLKKSLYQMSYLREPTKMCCSCCFISFWDTKYNTPHVFCLASYSTMLYESGHPFFACIAILPFLARSDSMTTY